MEIETGLDCFRYLLGALPQKQSFEMFYSSVSSCFLKVVPLDAVSVENKKFQKLDSSQYAYVSCLPAP